MNSITTAIASSIFQAVSFVVFFLASTTLLVFWGCTSESGSWQKAAISEPATVAVAYITSLMHGNTQEAKTFTTQASHTIIDQLSQIVAVDPDFTVKATADAISGPHAFVTLVHEQDTPQIVHLVKVKGAWKVNLIALGKAQMQRQQEQLLKVLAQKKLNNY